MLGEDKEEREVTNNYGREGGERLTYHTREVEVEPSH